MAQQKVEKHSARDTSIQQRTRNRAFEIALHHMSVLAALLAIVATSRPEVVLADDSNDVPLSGMAAAGKAVEVDEADIEAAEAEIWDPIEGFNRGTFWVNDQLDVYFMEPVARGYRYVLPSPVRKGVSNFFSNLRYPINFVNYVLQLNLSAAAEETGRFLVNTTVGVVGLFDVASDLGLEKGYNDFGLTFAHYGIPAGPYLVLPVLGPSNLRDLTGKVGDTLVHPTEYPYYINATTKDFRDWESRSTAVLEGLSRRAQLINAIESAKEASLDYYSFIQATYYQVRHGLLVENDDRAQGVKTNSGEFDGEPAKSEALPETDTESPPDLR